MKTISKFFGVVAAIAALAACNKESADVKPVVPEGKQKMEIKVNTGATKVACDGATGDLTWEADDQVAVVFQGSEVYCFSMESISAGQALFVSYDVPEGYSLEEVTDIYYPYVDDSISSYEDRDLPFEQDNLGGNGSFNKSTIQIPLHWMKRYGGDFSESGVILYADHTAMIRVPASDFVLDGNSATVELYTLEWGDSASDLDIESADPTYTYTISNIENGDDLIFFMNINLPEDVRDEYTEYNGVRVPYIVVNGEALRITEFGWGIDNPNSWAMFPSLPAEEWVNSGCPLLDVSGNPKPCRYLVRDYILVYYNISTPHCFFKTSYSVDIFSDDFTWDWMLENDGVFAAVYGKCEYAGQENVLCEKPNEDHGEPWPLGNEDGEIITSDPIRNCNNQCFIKMN